MNKFNSDDWIQKRKKFKEKLSLDYLFDGIISGNKQILSNAITLIESGLKADQEISSKLIEKCLPNAGKSIRIGVTGVPGVGKSTFIDVFGMYLVGLGKKVAVLSIDPSSEKNHGSILGDKTRMESLSKESNAFIRPSCSGNNLGGVARSTKEAMILCEAAGYDVILIETVGVGQSETMVHSLVDFFLLLMLSGAGDELQGIKRGIMEIADAVVITKADGDNKEKAKQAAINYKQALHYFPANPDGWVPYTLTYSYTDKSSVVKITNLIFKFFENKDRILTKRVEQDIFWVNDYLNKLIINDISNVAKNETEHIYNQVKTGNVAVYQAAKMIYDIYKKNEKN
jgi:LAO/AO transport system kinase